MRKAMGLAVVAAVAAVGAAGSWAASSAVQGGAVSVQEKEFKLIPKPTSITSGKVTFTVKNTGQLAHELVVLKTTLQPGKLPVKNNKAVETGRVGKVAVKKGKSATLVVTLQKGKYVLLCNVPAHYKAGQFAGFTIK